MSEKFLKHCYANIDTILCNKDSCYSLKALCTLLGYSEHGRNTSTLSKFCRENNIDISHFTSNGRPKNTLVDKVCPECNKTFSTIKGINGNITCSHLCANKHFKQAKKEHITNSQYAYRAKINGMTACAVCSETEVIDIHHIDEDRSNNELENLMPLCPTHHAYIHRGKYSLIESKVLEYLESRAIA